MELLKLAFESAYSIFTMEFTLMGFTFTFWSVFLWGLVASLIVWFIGKIFS